MSFEQEAFSQQKILLRLEHLCLLETSLQAFLRCEGLSCYREKDVTKIASFLRI